MRFLSSCLVHYNTACSIIFIILISVFQHALSTPYPSYPWTVSNNRISIYEVIDLKFDAQEFPKTEFIFNLVDSQLTWTYPNSAHSFIKPFKPTLYYFDTFHPYGSCIHPGYDAFDLTQAFKISTSTEDLPPQTSTEDLPSETASKSFAFSPISLTIPPLHNEFARQKVAIEINVEFFSDDSTANLDPRKFATSNSSFTLVLNYSLNGSTESISFDLPASSVYSDYYPIYTGYKSEIDSSSYLIRHPYFDSLPQTLRTYIVHQSTFIGSLPDIGFYPEIDEESHGSPLVCRGIGAITITPLTLWRWEPQFSDTTEIRCIINNKDHIVGTIVPYEHGVSTLIPHDAKDILEQTGKVQFSTNPHFQILLFIPLPLQTSLFQMNNAFSLFCPDHQFSVYSPNFKNDQDSYEWESKQHSQAFVTHMQSQPVRSEIRFYSTCLDNSRGYVLQPQNSFISESFPTLSPIFPRTMISNSSWIVSESNQVNNLQQNYHQSSPVTQQSFLSSILPTFLTNNRFFASQTPSYPSPSTANPSFITSRSHTILTSLTFHFGDDFQYNLSYPDLQDDRASKLFGYRDYPSLVLSVSNCQLDKEQFPDQTKGKIYNTLMADQTTRFLYFHTYIEQDESSTSIASPMRYSSSTGSAIYTILELEESRYSVQVNLSDFFLDGFRKTSSFPQLFHFKIQLKCNPNPTRPVSIASQLKITKEKLMSLNPDIAQTLSFQPQQFSDNPYPFGVAPVSFDQINILPPRREAINFERSAFAIANKIEESPEPPEAGSNFKLRFDLQHTQHKWSLLHLKLSFLSNSFIFNGNVKTCSLILDNAPIDPSNPLTTTYVIQHHNTTSLNDISAFFPLNTNRTNSTFMSNSTYVLPAPSVQDKGTFPTLYFSIKPVTTELPTLIELECSNLWVQSSWASDSDQDQSGSGWAEGGTKYANQDEILLVSTAFEHFPDNQATFRYYQQHSQLKFKAVITKSSPNNNTASSLNISLFLFALGLTLPLIIIIILAVFFWCKLRQSFCFKPHYLHLKKSSATKQLSKTDPLLTVK